MPLPVDQDGIDRAFNQGSDARLAGQSLSANPYGKGPGQMRLWSSWRLGWLDVSRHWPKDAKRAVAPLKPVETYEQT